MREKLNAPMPDEAIKQHPSKTYLSTIKAIYITERLNDVFGIGGWNMTHEIVSDIDDYVTVRGRIVYDKIALEDESKMAFKNQTPDQYGGGAKRDADIADAYKSAVTDCQSKCASYLEIGIDVFKGLHTHNKQPRKTTQKTTQKSDTPPSEKDDEISKAQWKYIKGCGEKLDLGEQDVVKFIKWVAKENGIEPRHWKITKLVLPEANFDTEYAKYTQREMETD